MFQSKLISNILFLAFSSAIFMYIGCKNIDSDHSNDNPKEALQQHVDEYSVLSHEDHQKVHSMFQPRLTYAMDMRDEQQYRYVLNSFVKAGTIPKTSPQFFKRLKELHENTEGEAGPPTPIKLGSIRSKGTPVSDQPGVFLADVAAESTVGDINVIQTLYNDDAGNYTGRFLTSVNGGVSSTNVLMNFRTIGQPSFFDGAWNPAGAQTEYYTETGSGTVPAGQSGPVIATAIIFPSSYDNPVIMVVEEDKQAIDQCVTAPNYQTNQGASKSCPPSGSTCINKGSISKQIVSCYGRNTGNCNYGWGGTKYPPYLTLEIAGSITFDHPIKNVGGAAQGLMRLYLEVMNGGCPLAYAGIKGTVPLPANFKINDDNSKILDYCFTSAEFPNDGCLTTWRGDVNLNLEVWVELIVDGTGSNIGSATVSSSACAGIGEPWCAAMPTIQVVQGCLANGTQITMADGSKRNIENFNGMGSEEVLAGDGSSHTVSANTVGVEFIPMYEINTDNGKSVLMSSKHAVPTARGVVLAKHLKVGDELTTMANGEPVAAKISSIDRVEYTDEVHNLITGTVAEGEAGTTTMYANDVLVGDLRMQVYHSERKREIHTLEELLQDVDEAWHEDVTNAYNSKK
ncbi:MAG: Hint domain-containing protein [Bacteroidota bacterium]